MLGIIILSRQLAYECVDCLQIHFDIVALARSFLTLKVSEFTSYVGVNLDVNSSALCTNTMFLWDEFGHVSWFSKSYGKVSSKPNCT